MEFAKYDEHARAALRAGVKDAFGGAFTVALTNLLELGTAVLILWLGGGMTMERPNPRMTIGSLITFQLYFNNVTSSYRPHQLLDEPRAPRVRVQGVLLQDNLPDIAPDAERSVDPGPGRGPEIELGTSPSGTRCDPTRSSSTACPCASRAGPPPRWWVNPAGVRPR